MSSAYKFIFALWGGAPDQPSITNFFYTSIISQLLFLLATLTVYTDLFADQVNAIQNIFQYPKKKITFIKYPLEDDIISYSNVETANQLFSRIDLQTCRENLQEQPSGKLFLILLVSAEFDDSPVLKLQPKHHHTISVLKCL